MTLTEIGLAAFELRYAPVEEGGYCQSRLPIIWSPWHPVKEKQPSTTTKETTRPVRETRIIQDSFPDFFVILSSNRFPITEGNGLEGISILGEANS
jgi:hypothetical protein